MNKSNYNALTWVQDELQTALNLALQGLNQFIDSPDNHAAIAQCIEQLYQVNGTLDMLNLTGSGLLVQQMHTTAAILRDNQANNIEQTQDALVRVLLLLPNYLKRIGDQLEDHPLNVIDSINELRQVSGETAIAAESLFKPSLVVPLPEPVNPNPNRAVPNIGIDKTKLSHVFQVYLLKWLRNADSESLGKMRGIMHFLRLSCYEEKSTSLWWAAEGIIEALSEQGLEASADIKAALGKLAQPIRLFIEESEQRLLMTFPEDLLRQLLFFVAQASSHGPHISLLKKTFGLHFFDHHNQIYGMSNNALADAHHALIEELQQIQQQINHHSSEPEVAIQQFEAVAIQLTNIAETLTLLTETTTSDQLAEQVAQLQSRINQGQQPDETQLGILADTLLKVQAKLQTLPGTDNGSSQSELHEVVISECLAELAIIKETFTLMVQGSHRDNQALASTIPRLQLIAGSLMMLNLPEAGRLLEQVSSLITEYDQRQQPLNNTQLRYLAEVLASCDLYMEGIRQHEQLQTHLLEDASAKLTEFDDLAATPSTTEKTANTATMTFSDANPTDFDFDFDLETELTDAVAMPPEQTADDDDLAEAPPTTATTVDSAFSTDNPTDIDFDLETELTDAVAMPPEQTASDDDLSITEQTLSPPQETDAESTTTAHYAENIDTEIADIFIEEANEVLSDLHLLLHQWQQRIDDMDIATIRRHFHTLKGSGRMAGADLISELARSIEQLLNRAMEGLIQPNRPLWSLVERAYQHIPELITRFTQGQLQATQQAADLIAEAKAFEADLQRDLAAEQITPTAETSKTATAKPHDHTSSPFTLDQAWTISKPDSKPETRYGISASAQDKKTTSASSVDENELQQIFNTEAQQHLSTLKQLIAERQSGQPVQQEELRAIHSLKGCANVAQVTPIATIATDFDHTLRLLHSQQIPLTTEQQPHLNDIIEGLEQLLASINDETISKPDIWVIAATINKLKALANPVADEQAIDPEFLVVFLEETDELLDVYTEHLTHWQQQPEDLQLCQQLHRSLHQLQAHAQQAEQHTMADLYQLLDSLVATPSAQQQTRATLLDEGYEALNEHIECLIQNKPMPSLDNFAQRVEAFIFDDISASMAEPPTVEDPLVELPDSTVAVEPPTVEDPLVELPDSAVAVEPPTIEDPLVELPDSVVAVEPPTIEDPLVELPDSVVAVEPPTIEDPLVELPDSVVEPPTVEGPLVELPDSVVAVEPPTVEDPLVDLPDSAVEPSAITSPLFEIPTNDLDILQIFTEEAAELLASSGQAIKDWQQTPEDQHAAQQLQRDLHTIKGGARLAAITPMADLTHEIESLVLAIGEHKYPADQAFFDLLQRSQDRLTEMQEYLAANTAIPVANDLLGEIEHFPSEPQPTIIDAPPVHQAPVPRQAGPQPANKIKTTAHVKQVRVRADLLDYLTNFAGEVSISRDRATQQHTALHLQLREMEETVNRLHGQLRKLEIETETQILFRYEDEQHKQHSGFDPLELDRFSTIQQLSRSLTESVIDLNDISHSMDLLVRETNTILLQQSRINADLQQGLINARLLPFDGIIPRLERIVRQTNATLGKQSELYVQGSDLELDRTILDRMLAPIEHILRNAITHGIELPAKRRSQGKDESGRLTLTLAHEGSEILISITDDGHGIDMQKIKQIALSQKLITADHIPADDLLIQYILTSGFSTAGTASQLAGRGVGMDVVNNEINALKGRLTIQTIPGQGTTFNIRLPLTLSVIQALLITSNDQQFAVPLANVKAGQRINASEVRKLLSSHHPHYMFNGEQYSLVPMCYLSDAPFNLPDNPKQPLPLLLFKSGDIRIALLVDEINSNREIVIKSIGQQLGHIRTLNGASILGDGRIVFILDIAALLESNRSLLHRDSQALSTEHESEQSAEHPPVAMVVDDSITMRKATSSLLKRLSFDVVTARDGIDALALLHQQKPAIILLDVEMPRMDGFEFASIVRNDTKFKHLPIIMITSRTGNKHRQRAMSLGVDAYLGKPYQENELVTVMQKLLAGNYPHGNR